MGSTFFKDLANTMVTNGTSNTALSVTTYNMKSNDHIIVNKDMLAAINAKHSTDGNSVIDTQKFDKVMNALRGFESKHGISPNGYILSGFDDINSFRVESITSDEVAGTYNVNKQVIAKVTGNTMEIVALVHGKVNI